MVSWNQESQVAPESPESSGSAPSGSKNPAAGVVWQRLLQFPTRAMFLALAAACLVGPLLVGGIAWRTLTQLDQIDVELNYRHHLQRFNVLLQHFAADRRAGSPLDPAQLAELRGELSAISSGEHEVRSPESALLEQVAGLLAAPEIDAGELALAARLVDETVRDAVNARRQLSDRLQTEARAEIETATGLFLGLALLVLGGAWFLQRRILRPLEDLRTMFLGLAAGDFSPITPKRMDPALAPLFDNYNRLVTRLAVLEGEHRSRAAHLEEEVRSATEALLEQQRTLSHAERLAAVGEMAASMAHELRNPLAGIQLNLANLRRDLSDPQLVARLELALAELERMARLLDQQLSAARHAPEMPRWLNLRTLVENLFALLRYQVPAHVHLEAKVDGELDCWLPRDRLRQALLNLVLNSVQAMGDDKGTVRVEGQRQGDRMILVVTDDGPGFPPGLIRARGQTFVTQRAQGTGLGLAMVRRLAAELGGELVLENLEPRGARVRLVLHCDG